MLGPGRKTSRPQNPADGEPGEHPDADPIEQVDREPLADPPARVRADRGHGDRGVGERKGEPVVEPGLRGQREPHLVLAALLVGGLAHLHIRGQHRVGRGDRRRQQDRRGRRQPQQPAQPSRATTTMDNGIVMASSRQVVAHRRQPTGRSRARPAPISATITHTSVRCTVTVPCSNGLGSGSPSNTAKTTIPAVRNDHRHRHGHPAQGSGQHGREQRGQAADSEEPGEDVHLRCLPQCRRGRAPRSAVLRVTPTREAARPRPRPARRPRGRWPGAARAAAATRQPVSWNNPRSTTR